MKSSFFRENRERLIEELDTADAVVSVSYDGKADTAGTNLWYLSGIREAGWELLIDVSETRSWLIAPDVDEIHRIFDGSLSMDEAKLISGVDEVISSEQGRALKMRLPKPISHKKALAKVRAIKRPEEIDCMSEAARLTIDAVSALKSKLREYDYEYQAEADITWYFRWNKAAHAFDPIVASGHNACTLHYVKNASRLDPDSLLLVDVGAKVEAYAADISRTFALRDVSARQLSVHQAVQAAQKEIITLLKPGVGIEEYVRRADTVMIKTLTTLGLMRNPKDTEGFRRYFPHSISHGLGLDVHESLGGFKEFQPGMVLTVEPGIYIQEEAIGVRIEDDILITEDGNRNLTGRLSTDI